MIEEINLDVKHKKKSWAESHRELSYDALGGMSAIYAISFRVNHVDREGRLQFHECIREATVQALQVFCNDTEEVGPRHVLVYTEKTSHFIECTIRFHSALWRKYLNDIHINKQLEDLLVSIETAIRNKVGLGGLKIYRRKFESTLGSLWLILVMFGLLVNMYQLGQAVDLRWRTWYANHAGHWVGIIGVEMALQFHPLRGSINLMHLDICNHCRLHSSTFEVMKCGTIAGTIVTLCTSIYSLLFWGRTSWKIALMMVQLVGVCGNFAAMYSMHGKVFSTQHHMKFVVLWLQQYVFGIGFILVPDLYFADSIPLLNFILYGTAMGLSLLFFGLFTLWSFEFLEWNNACEWIGATFLKVVVYCGIFAHLRAEIFAVCWLLIVCISLFELTDYSAIQMGTHCQGREDPVFEGVIYEDNFDVDQVESSVSEISKDDAMPVE